MKEQKPLIAFTTSIQVLKTTKDRLAKLGSKGDTYDGIIVRLLAEKAAREAKTP